MKNLHCLPKRIIIKRRISAQALAQRLRMELGLQLGLAVGTGRLGGSAVLRSQTKQRPIISPSFDLAQRPRCARSVCLSLPLYISLYLSLFCSLNY